MGTFHGHFFHCKFLSRRRSSHTQSRTRPLATPVKLKQHPGIATGLGQTPNTLSLIIESGQEIQVLRTITALLGMGYPLQCKSLNDAVSVLGRQFPAHRTRRRSMYLASGVPYQVCY